MWPMGLVWLDVGEISCAICSVFPQLLDLNQSESMELSNQIIRLNIFTAVLFSLETKTEIAAAENITCNLVILI